MSVADVKSTPNQDAARKNQWSLVYGLYWAAFLLLLLAVWIHSKYWELGPSWAAWVVAVLAVVSLGAAVLQTLQFRGMSRQAPETQQTQLARLRQQSILLFYGLASVLLVMMLLVVFQAPPDPAQPEANPRLVAFPLVSCGVLLALVGFLTGFLLSAGGEKSLSQQHVLEMMVRSRQQVMTGCLVIGGVFLLLGVVIFFRNQPAFTVFPEGAGAILIGLIFLGIGMWHLLGTPKELTVANMRILVLVAGGTAGLVIAAMTAIRALMWREQVFAGGMSAWQGPEAWRLWLCTWVELFGLALMFGSLYLAQADIRFNPVLRRLLYGYNAIFTGILVVAALAALNVVVYASFPYTFNWTKDLGFYSLSDKSKNVLYNLKQPTTVWIVMSTKGLVYIDTKNMLDNCQAYTNKLSVKEISPDTQEEAYNQLAKNYPKLAEARKSVQGNKSSSGLLVIYGGEGTKEKAPPHVFIPASELSDTKGQGQVYKGEDALMTQLQFLEGGGTKPVIYFTQGNEELNIKDPTPRFIEGGGLLAEKLKVGNTVRQLIWGPPGIKADEDVGFTQTKSPKAKEPHRIPEDAKAVVIAWPKSKFTAEQLEALSEYMSPARNGKLLILSNAVDTKGLPVKTGLEDFLKKYGVEMREDFILHLFQKYAPAADARPRPNSGNPIATAFENYGFLLAFPRTVKPLSGVGSFSGDVILEVMPKQGQIAWAETDLNALNDLEDYVQRLTKKNQLWEKRTDEPIPVGVAVSASSPSGTVPRLVVFGDGRMASNSLLGPDPYYELIASSLAWLGERPQEIGIPPLRRDLYILRTNSTNFSMRRMTLLPFGLMTLGLVGIGLGVWVVRRP